jgi:hypothetical protein
MENTVIDLEIIEEIADSGVQTLSLVESPAIEKNWMAFKRQEFVTPSGGETKDEFVSRCIAKLVGDEGYDNDQAAAICYSTWSEEHAIEPNPCWDGYEPYGLKDDGTPNCIPVKSKKEKFSESYTDYPEAAKNAAQRALDWAEEHGWGDCGMGAGKARANQLAKGEPISEETIARMASFARHKQNSDTPYSEGCGKLMWDAWGSDAGIEWAQRKLKQIREEKMSYDVSALPPYVDELPKKKKEEMESTELDIYGYRTKDFHMCPGAVGTFQHLMEMEPDEETIGMIRAAAVIADNIFGLEEKVLEEGVSSYEDVKEALVLVDDFQDVMGEIDEAVGMEHDIDYMIGHVEKIKELYDEEIVEAKMSKFIFASEDQKIIIGPAMVPDKIIPRIDPDTKEKYKVRFSAETISKVAEKFMRELRNDSTNVEHNPEVNANSYVKESWIVETEDDKANTKYGLDVPVGTWMVSMRVTDPKIWKMVKAGELNGISIEGNFMDKREYSKYKKDRETYDRVMKILKSM